MTKQQDLSRPPLEQAPQPIVVAVSGSGRSLANLLHWQKELGAYTVAGVIASADHCPANTIAKAAGLPLLVEAFTGSNQPSLRLINWLRELAPQWIALAGFLKIFPTAFAAKETWAGRILNIHPSLLPQFAGKHMYGKRVHGAVLAAKVKESGASIHFVNARYDEGPVIAQVRVPVEAGDDVESLARRVFAAECLLYPRTLCDLIAGRLPLKNGEIFRYPHEEMHSLCQARNV